MCSAESLYISHIHPCNSNVFITQTYTSFTVSVSQVVFSLHKNHRGLHSVHIYLRKSRFHILFCQIAITSPGHIRERCGLLWIGALVLIKREGYFSIFKCTHGLYKGFSCKRKEQHKKKTNFSHIPIQVS